jgi:hypothetical protein
MISEREKLLAHMEAHADITFDIVMCDECESTEPMVPVAHMDSEITVDIDKSKWHIQKYRCIQCFSSLIRIRMK